MFILHDTRYPTLTQKLPYNLRFHTDIFLLCLLEKNIFILSIFFDCRGSKGNAVRRSYIPSSVSLCGSFLLAFSSLIINSLGVPGHKVEFVILNTCFVQSATTTVAVGTLIAMSSWKRIPLDFQLMQGSLIAGGVAAGAIAITRIVPWASFLLGIITGKIKNFFDTY